MQNISFIKIDLEYKRLVIKPPKNTPRNIPKASELLTRAYALRVSIGWQKHGTPNSAAGQYIPAEAPTNDCPIMYKKVSLEKMRHKLAAILSIEEVTIGNCIFPVLLR